MVWIRCERPWSAALKAMDWAGWVAAVFLAACGLAAALGVFLGLLVRDDERDLGEDSPLSAAATASSWVVAASARRAERRVGSEGGGFCLGADGLGLGSG